jgi:hypothetical protein
MEGIVKVIGDLRSGVVRVFSVLRDFAVFMRTIGPKNPRKCPVMGELQHFFFKSPAASLII